MQVPGLLGRRDGAVRQRLTILIPKKGNLFPARL